MAATNFRVSYLVLCFIVFYHLTFSPNHLKLNSYYYGVAYEEIFHSVDSENDFIQEMYAVWCNQPAATGAKKLNLTPTGFFQSRFPASKWTKHGLTTLLIPGHDPPSDITIFMDVSLNPGPPTVVRNIANTQTDLYNGGFLKTTESNMHIRGSPTETITYSRHKLLDLRRCSTEFTCNTQGFKVLKEYMLLRYRSSRAGKRRITVRVSRRADDVYCSICPKQESVNTANLIAVPRTPLLAPAASSKSVDVCLLNARSVKNKSFIIKDFVVDHNIDLLALTETWLRSDVVDQEIINDLCPTGYFLMHVPRGSRGGGVAILHKKCFKFKKQFTASTSYKSFEFTDMLMRYSSTNVRMVIVYRPPPSKKNGLTLGLFLEEFTCFLEQLVSASAPLLIVGDFNFHTDIDNDPAAIRFTSLLEAFNLMQHINVPTHRNGHTLDLVITRVDENFVTNFTVTDPVISDHYAVHCTLSLRKPCFERKEITYRKLRSVDKALFRQDIKKSSLMSYENFVNVSDLVDQYYEILSSLLELHAPLKKRVVTLRPAAPWYSDEIRAEKTKRKRLERQWRANRLTINRNMYVDQCNLVSSLIFESKMKFYSNIIKDNKLDQRVLFRTVDKLLNRKPVKKLPSSDRAYDLANKFADFFTNKVQAIKDSLISISHGKQDLIPAVRCSSELRVFSPTSVDELSALTGASACKSCILDPIPGSVFKDSLDVLLPVITRIVNLSLVNSVMPTKMKEAVLTPALKKSSLDHELFQNFRPISNLMFISKATEKVVASRLNSYIEDENLAELFQSAYKKGHSTETALARVQNDILRAIDNQGCVILLLLDLSAAFDTVDHQILLRRLSDRFGIKDQALAWVRSYLSDRSQFVCVDTERSSNRELTCGVPQGSVLGPILYLLYTSPLGDIVRLHNMSYHLYADDTQIYISFQPSDVRQPEHSRLLIESCMRDIDLWMTMNRLKLNNDKTELLVLNARHRPQPPLDSIFVGNELIKASKSARNIGVLFDNTVSMEQQVNTVCKVAFFHIRNIARIRKFLSSETCKILIHSFVTSKLDYCNSLLYGLPKNLTQKLQYVQNSAARRLCYALFGNFHV